MRKVETYEEYLENMARDWPHIPPVSATVFRTVPDLTLFRTPGPKCEGCGKPAQPHGLCDGCAELMTRGA